MRKAFKLGFFVAIASIPIILLAQDDRAGLPAGNQQQAQDPELEGYVDVAEQVDIHRLKQRLTEDLVRVETLENSVGEGHPSVTTLRRQIEMRQRLLMRALEVQKTADDTTLQEEEEERFEGSASLAAQANLSPQQLRKNFAQLVSDLRAADSDSDRAELRQQLQELLRNQLVLDYRRRDGQLSATEKRVAALRKQLEETRRNHDKIADVLLMMIENPQAGVGLPAQWMQAIASGTDGAAGDFDDDPFSDANPFADGGGSPFGDSSAEDPFADGFGAASDPFAEPTNTQDPFGNSGNSRRSGSQNRSESDPLDALLTDNRFAMPAARSALSTSSGGPNVAYEVSTENRDIAVYHGYDKGVPVLTNESVQVAVGESVEVGQSNVQSVWIRDQGHIRVEPPPEGHRGTLSIVGVKAGKTQIALLSTVAGTRRINVEVTPFAATKPKAAAPLGPPSSP